MTLAIAAIMIVAALVIAVGFFRGRRRRSAEDTFSHSTLQRLVERHERDQVGRE